MFSEEAFHKAVRILFGILLIIAGIFLFFRYLFGALLPFLIAYLIAFCLQPLVRALEKRAGISRKVTVLFAVFLIVALLIFLCVLIFRRISGELVSLAESLGKFLTRLREDPAFADEMVARISDKIPFVNARPAIESFISDLDGRLTELLGMLAERLSGSVLPFLAGLAAFLPNALLSVLVVLISSYYLAIDFRQFHAFLLSFFSEPTANRLRKIKRTLTDAGGSFFRAYGLILLVTFSELFSALLILGYRYAFLIALATAFIDILPVLGTGTVLLPWAAFQLLTGHTSDGIGLLIVYAIMTIVRQVIEPKIVGKYIGLPPLAALASMYLGLQLLGFWGLFLFPIGALLLWRLLKTHSEQEKEEVPGDIEQNTKKVQ